MKSSVPGSFFLESLSKGIPALTPAKAAVLKEGCIWCLTQCQHENGVTFDCVFCNKDACFSVKWIDDTNIKDICTAYNSDDAVEFGAEAVSLLLIKEETEFTAIERSVQGTGIDYWLGYKSRAQNQIFSMQDARLEISGILRENASNSVKNRIKTKLKQVKPTNYVFPVFISIVEFSNPKAEAIRKDEAY